MENIKVGMVTVKPLCLGKVPAGKADLARLGLGAET